MVSKMNNEIKVMNTKVELNIPPQINSSELCLDIIKTFGLSETGWIEKLSQLDVPVNGVILITGPSGVGKSLLLKEIEKNFSSIKKIPSSFDKNKAIADMLPYESAGEVIRYLSKFGLGEPRILIGPFSHLSDGQKERFLIALALLEGNGPLILDEFTTRLDRCTAQIVALNLGKILNANNQSAFIASCHDDIKDFLNPDFHIKLSSNGECSVYDKKSKQIDFLDSLGVEIKKGTIADYKKLSRYHYENDNPNDIDMLSPMVDQVVTAHSHGELVGVNLCTKPWPKLFEKFSEFAEINKSVQQSFRLIVHPQYRGIGLTKALDVIPNPGTKVLLAWSAFTSYYSFPILAGYHRVQGPFEEMSEEEKRLQLFVEKLQKDKGKSLHLISECNKIWMGIEPEEQKKLKQLVVEAASEKSLRLACFQRKISALDTPVDSQYFIRSLFLKLYSKSSNEALPMLLAETVYRPMATFIKNIEFGDFHG